MDVRIKRINWKHRYYNDIQVFLNGKWVSKGRVKWSSNKHKNNILVGSRISEIKERIVKCFSLFVKLSYSGNKRKQNSFEFSLRTGFKSNEQDKDNVANDLWQRFADYLEGSDYGFILVGDLELGVGIGDVSTEVLVRGQRVMELERELDTIKMKMGVDCNG